MPETKNQRDRSLDVPALCEQLPVRDFLDDFMVRTDGSYVAGYRLAGSSSYFADDHSRNEMKSFLESLLRTIPEESMRVQFRYEVLETSARTINKYEEIRRTNSQAAIILDEDLVKTYRQKDADGEYLTRKLHVYFIWSPEKYRQMMLQGGSSREKSASGKKKDKSPWESARSWVLQQLGKGPKIEEQDPDEASEDGPQGLGPFTTSTTKAVQYTHKQHLDTVHHFNSILMGIESSLKVSGLGPERMTHKEMFLEIKRALNPLLPDDLPLKPPKITDLEYRSVREQLACVSFLGETETYMNIDGVLWSMITLKMSPDSTFPGVVRELQTAGFPISVSTQVTIPDQSKVLDHYKRMYKKMVNAQKDHRGNQRVDITAQVAAQELLDIQAQILASSTKTARVSMTIAVRTSGPAITEAEYALAQRELAMRRQMVIHIIGRMNGAKAYSETLAQKRLFFSSLPGMADKDKRDLDLLTSHVADLLPVELPWAGTEKYPLMIFDTPYRQCFPFSPFDPNIENANMLVAATSGTGKSVLIGKMLLTSARQGVKVSILERGDSYYYPVKYMGGQMITMSLDSPYTINPFDLEPGQLAPTNDHLSFLTQLVHFMIGETGSADPDLLESTIRLCLKDVYKRRYRSEKDEYPLLSDLQLSLQYFQGSPASKQEAHMAAEKLKSWVDDGMYAKLFDRHTTVNMQTPWLYFNIEQLKDDPRLDSAMSLLIAYATTRRAQGDGTDRSIVVLDECWQLLESPTLAPVVVQLFRTARKRNACVWAVSQAVEDFTGTPDNPNKFGGAILATTAIRMIGRQKGNFDVLRLFLHFNDTILNRVKMLGMTEKGKKSEFLVSVGERADWTLSLYVVMSAMMYWLTTTYPREKYYREWWFQTHPTLDLTDAIRLLAEKYPNGISALDELPEERSGDVIRAFTSKKAA
jgi:type IV secretory pathway VirB4 component